MLNNLLVIGTGSIGKRHIENFKKYFKNIDIADTRIDRLNEVKKKFKIRKYFRNYKKALISENYKAAVISTPPNSHLRIAAECEKKNISVFIEKPLGMNEKGWKSLANKFKKKNLISYVGFCHRHINFTKEAKRILDSKKIGKICGANIRWGSYLPDWHPWENYRTYYMAKKNQGGGALYDECHGIDLLRYFLGEISEVSALVGNTSELKISSDDSAFLNLKMKKGFYAQINFDLYSRFPRVSFEIIGSKGTVIWDRVECTLKIFTAKSKKWKIKNYSKKDLMNMYLSQAKYFYQLLKKKKNSLPDIEDALKTQKVIDAGFLSNKLKKSIKINI
jgi:predicted dehydrogenase